MKRETLEVCLSLILQARVSAAQDNGPESLALLRSAKAEVEEELKKQPS